VWKLAYNSISAPIKDSPVPVHIGVGLGKGKNVDVGDGSGGLVGVDVTIGSTMLAVSVVKALVSWGVAVIFTVIISVVISSAGEVHALRIVNIISRIGWIYLSNIWHLPVE